MRRLLCLLLVLLLILPPAVAEQTATVEDCRLLPGEAVEIRYYLPVTGQASLVLLDEAGREVRQILSPRQLLGGQHVLQLSGDFFDADMPQGVYTLRLTWAEGAAEGALTLGEGMPAPAAPTAAPTQLPPGETITPALRSSHRPQHDNCYWCTPMDLSNEKAIWGMLTAPITVVDTTMDRQVYLYAEPSEKSEAVGMVSGASQALHVLETRSDGWTLVECYSSSFHDSKVKNWNGFVTGYIQTKRLKQREVNQEYGIVIDKLTQKLYLFHNGSLITELLASTGLYNERQPYNETRSGEYIIISRTGDFKSDNLVCAMALRYNRGDLLHEVPHTLSADGTKNYTVCEAKLGTRASHGCLRVQRRKNADGYNMKWLWENIKVGTKLVIWEDYQGRQMAYPDDSLTLYYNPNGGTSYHSMENCPGIKKQYLPLTPFSYGELENSPYAAFTPCTYCYPVPRRALIDEVNRVHMEMSPGEIMSLIEEK